MPPGSPPEGYFLPRERDEGCAGNGGEDRASPIVRSDVAQRQRRHAGTGAQQLIEALRRLSESACSTLNRRAI
jgi:hypothetical protein